MQKFLNEARDAAGERVLAAQRDTAHIEAAVQQYCIPDYLDKGKIEALYEFDLTYTPALSKLDRLEQHIESDRPLSRAFQFAKGDFKEKLYKLKRTYGSSSEQIAMAQEADNASIAKIQEGYAKHIEEADKRIKELYQDAKSRQERDRLAWLEKTYEDACNKMRDADSINGGGMPGLLPFYSLGFLPVYADAWREAGDLFLSCGDYKDSADLARKCLENADYILNGEKADNSLSKKKRRRENRKG